MPNMFMLKARSRVVDVPGAVLVLTRPLFIVAVMLALLVSAGVAYAQDTPTAPTIESVALTSDPGEDGGYAIGDEIQVGLTFSEAVTVTGAPQLTLDVGVLSRTAEYSEGSTTTRLLFTYTVATGDEDTDGIAVVANSLALNGGAIHAGATNDAALTHGGLQSDDHKVDGIAPTVTVGGETRTYVPPDRQFSVAFYFSEKVYGITDQEIVVTNGAAHDMIALSGSTRYPRYTRWKAIIVPAGEGPVTVDLPAGAAVDAYGNPNATSSGPLRVIAADPVTVEVTRTTSGFAEGGRAEFIVTRSRDNGAIPVVLSVDQTGDFLSGTVEVYPPPDPNMPENPVTPTEVEFTETPFTLNVTFAAGETSKRIAALTEDDYRVENDGTVTLSVPARPGQYKYIPGYASSTSADVRNNDVSATVSLYWSRPFNPYTTTTLDTALEGGSIDLTVYGVARGEPLLVTLAVTEVGSYLDLDGEGADGYEDLGNGKLRVTLPVGLLIKSVSIPLLENDVREADGSVTITVEADPENSYIPRVGFGALTIPIKDNDTPSTVTVTISAPDSIAEGGGLSYTLTRTWDPGQSWEELSVNVALAQTGGYITWPTARQPDAEGLVTIPVTFAARSLTATLTLETVDDEVSEADGSVTATILADASGSYVTGADSDHTTKLLDNDPPIISVSAVSAEVTEGTDAQFRFTRIGNTGVATRLGLYVGGLQKIMTDATEATVLTSETEDPAERLTINGAVVDYIVEFAPGETEKTLSLTTEADNVNEGDGWLGVRIARRAANPFGIGAGYARVHVHDDDIPTVSLTQVALPTGAATLEGDTWVGDIVEGNSIRWVMSCSGNYEYSSPAGGGSRRVAVLMQQLRLANHPAFYGDDTQHIMGHNLLAYRAGGNCDGLSRVSPPDRRYVGPDGGQETFELIPRDLEPPIVATYLEAYRVAKAEADMAGTRVTKRDIIHPSSVGRPYGSVQFCSSIPDELQYCPQYQVGTPHKIRLNLINRDPTILIKAESDQVVEGNPARFVLERLWNKELYGKDAQYPNTVVLLRASQDGQYINGALPTQITFGRHATSTVIELTTVGDEASGADGSVTIELLPDTTGPDLNVQGEYTTREYWLGHTPEGGRSDRATVTITNDDIKPGIAIAPAWATEGDSNSTTNMTFTVTLARAVTTPVRVKWATSDGTAIAGNDYTAATGTAEIATGATSATFVVSVTGDEADEPDETFKVTISMPDPEPSLDGSVVPEPAAAIIGGDTATVTGRILDDDPTTVTITARSAEVVEGEDAVFTLTRSGFTSEEMEVVFVLRGSGRQEMLSATFEPGATTTESSHTTVDDAFVNYPPRRVYAAVLLGDSLDDLDDTVWTPGSPATATVTVTDNDVLQIVTVIAAKEIVAEGENDLVTYRREGDVSESLTINFRIFRDGGDTSFDLGDRGSVTFKKGEKEVQACLICGAEIGALTITRSLHGDGGINGQHRIWRAGVPNTATVVIYAGDPGLELHAQYSNTASINDQDPVIITFTVRNTGMATTGDPIVITSVQRDNEDTLKDGQSDPRVGCTITGAIGPGASKECNATFPIVQDDVDSAPLVLDATATTTIATTTVSSTPFRIYITIMEGISVGFEEPLRLQITESTTATADLVVKRTGALEEEVRVAYITRPFEGNWDSFTATAGEDYADRANPPGIIEFAADAATTTISFDIIHDEVREQRERFEVVLQPPDGVRLIEGRDTKIVTIVDNRDGVDYRPEATLHLNEDGPIMEDSGSVEFAVRLNYAFQQSLLYHVSLDSGAGDAVPGVDFVDPLTVTVNLAPGQKEKTFTVALIDDDEVEDPEDFSLSMTADAGNHRDSRLGTTTRATATIVDDDRVAPSEVRLVLTFMGDAFESVPESAGARDVTVTASFHADTPVGTSRTVDPLEVDTTVRVTFDPGSTADRGDFQEVESFEIVIPAGRTSATATLRFRPVNDDVDEDDETVTLRGSVTATGFEENSLSVVPASFTITDDDTRGITVVPASIVTAFTGINLRENGDPVTYTVVLDSQPTDTVTIAMEVEADGQLKVTPTPLTFTAHNWDTPQTVTVLAQEDGVVYELKQYEEYDHEVSGGDYDEVVLRDVRVGIVDTTKPKVYLEGAQASESAGHINFKVTVRPNPRIAVELRYTTVDGTAVAGRDYTRQVEPGATSTYKIFRISTHQPSHLISIPIIDNQVYQPAEKTFTLQLRLEGDKATLAGDAVMLTATGTITDDDPAPVVSVSGPEGRVSHVSEDAKDPVSFTLTLTGESAEDVTVDYATGEARLVGLRTARQGVSGATADEDYTSATGTVTFTSGQTTSTVTVQVTSDDVSEDTEYFGFRISNPRNAELTGRRAEDVVDVGILDNDARGVMVAPRSLMLVEPARGATTTVSDSYSVVLTSQPTDEVTVTVGGQYEGVVTLSTTTLTFATSTWNRAQRVTVTPAYDFNAVSESVVLTHTPSGGGYTRVPVDSVTVRVRDSDTRGIIVSKDELTLKEGGSDTYTVELRAQPIGTTTVSVIGAGSVSPTSSELTFGTSNWNVPQSVTLNAAHDDGTDDEPKVFVRHEASGGDYNRLRGPDVGVIVRDDDIEVRVSYESGSYVVAEGATTTIEIVLSADPEKSVTIPVVGVGHGGATSADFSLSATNVTFNSGDTSQPITFAATQDTVDDDGESVLLAFGALPTGVTAGSPSETTVSIRDDDDDPAVMVSFGAATYRAIEGSTAAVTVELSADPERTVAVPITKTNERGVSDSDYSGVPASITFNSGDTEKTITFTATADSLNESGERVKLSFGTLPTRVSEGTPAETTVTISDSTQAQTTLPTIHFGSASYTVSEGGSVDVTVTLSKAPGSEAVIPLTASNQGGATASDYSGVPTSVTFGAAETSKTFTVTAAQDTVDDDGESILLGFGTLPGGITATTGQAAATTVSIRDDDDPQVTVSFGASTYTAAEGGTATVTVTLSADPERTVAIPVTKTDQGGASAADYSGVPATVTFDTGDTSQPITFAATQDTEDDDGESVLLAFGALPTGVTAGATDETTVSIRDDDDPQVTVSFGASTYTAAEGGTATVTVTLSADPERTVEVPITTTNQGGATSADFSLSATNVTFNSGDTSKTVVFTATQDTEDDDGESVRLAFGATLPAGVSEVSPSETTVSITDDDDPGVTVSFGAATYTAAEGGTATVTVTLSADPERTVAIPVTKTNQGGASAADYSGVPATVTFDTGDTSQPITFAATQDTEDDDGESVLLAFGALPTGVTAGATDETTVSIRDDDDPQVTVSFGASTYTAAEGGTATVTVTLSADPERTVEVPITTTNQGGATSADFSLSATNVTFNSGDTSKTVVFTATQDTEDDDGESVRLAFGATLPAGVSEVSPSETTVSITDDDDPGVTVSFGAATYTAAEGGTATVTVTLSADPERTVAIPVTKTNQGGASAADYSGVPATVTFDTGGHVAAHHLRGDPGHGGRRRGERAAGLRGVAHRGDRGGDRRDDGQHQGRRRPAGDGQFRGQHVHGGGGGHGHGDGDAERRPGADGRGPDHHDEPGRRDLCRLQPQRH